jgi:HK97 family phage portal protein
MGLKALFFGSSNGQAITVTPGDALWDAVSNAPDDRLLSIRELATQHWAVAAVHGQLSRAMAGLEVRDVMRSPDSDLPTRDQRVAPLLRPHLGRIARDLARFGEAILAYATDSDGNIRELVPLPPDKVEVEVKGGRAVEYKIDTDTKYKPEQVLHIAPELPAVSPLESLRGLLGEDIAAETWRREAWRFAPRGFVERPIEAPEWSEDGMKRFLSSLTGRHKKPAGIDLLEEGMKFDPVELPNAQAAEYIASRKLAAEAVASVYGVQGSLLAIGQDKQLSQARRQLLSGPVSDYARLVEEAASAQLCVQLYGAQAINGRIRPALDIASALRREDEESNVTVAATGGPWRTRAEQRAREGLSFIEGTDELIAPTTTKAVITE